MERIEKALLHNPDLCPFGLVAQGKKLEEGEVFTPYTNVTTFTIQVSADSSRLCAFHVQCHQGVLRINILSGDNNSVASLPNSVLSSFFCI